MRSLAVDFSIIFSAARLSERSYVGKGDTDTGARLFGSIRMESSYVVMGEAAGIAASHAIKSGKNVHEDDVQADGKHVWSGLTSSFAHLAKIRYYKSQWSDYNKLYYDPAINYVHWPDRLDADPDDPERSKVTFEAGFGGLHSAGN